MKHYFSISCLSRHFHLLF